MKRLLLLIAAVAAMIPCAYGKDSGNRMDEFLGHYDMHWTEIKSDWDKPGPGRPSKWQGKNKRGYYTGAIMGNGLLGTNLYKLEPNTYRLNVGRSDVTEQRQPYNLYNSGRLPIGYFTLATVGNVQKEDMTLSIYDARTYGTFTTDKGSIDFSTYVHALKDVVVFETSTTGEEKDYTWSFVPFKAISPVSFNVPAPSDYLNSEGKSNPDSYTLEKDGMNFLIQPLALDTTFIRIAKYYAVGWKEVRKGSTRRIFATVSIEPTEEAAVKAASEILVKAARTSSASLQKSHTQWWHNFYSNAAFVSIPDPAFERLYWMQYYKFASTARPGKPVVDLMGVWPTFDTPWPAIWANLNIQLTYSFQTKANMGEFSQPLWDTLWENRENLTRNVTEIPGQESWTDAACLPRTCTYDFHAPLDPKLVDVNCYEVGNLAWTLFYWYRQCLAYGDTEQMRDKLFPLLKAAVNCFFHIRITNPDGTYSLPPTASPEYSGGNIGPNSNYDLANLRQGLLELIDIDERFSINDPMLPQWKDFLAKMPDFQYSKETGFKVSETTEFLNTNHRHYSHLFMIYPYHMLDWNDAEARSKANFSIDRWQGDQGYSRTGKAAMLASENLGDEALKQMQIFIDKFLQPNTLYAESGPVIETPLAAVSTLQEFYMQDWGDRIRVFYGCPSKWRDASFERLRAAGAFLISATRTAGETVNVHVLSEKGGNCRIQCEIPAAELTLKDSKGRAVEYKSLDVPGLESGWSVIEFSTNGGSEYVLARDSSKIMVERKTSRVMVGGGTSRIMVGGYTSQRALSDEDKALFKQVYVSSVEGYVPLTPQTVATQVVAGTNYCFICKDKSGRKYKVIIYEPLPGRGDPEVTSITEM